jgi:hypothetical protein
LLKNGANVIIYIQHEETSGIVGSQEQASLVVRMSGFSRGVGDVFNFPSGNLKIRKYRVPSSVHGIRIDEQALSIGRYIYEHVDSAKRSSIYSTDSIRILGHQLAAIVVWKGTEEFEVLNKMFNMLEMKYQKDSEEMPMS